jgi:hypothetical protein
VFDNLSATVPAAEEAQGIQPWTELKACRIPLYWTSDLLACSKKMLMSQKRCMQIYLLATTSGK